ncbi:MAG: FAD-dependent tricarballylate dehydrogenase TcuA [Alphaproteobacteria bacterium]|nr:FAD-dependent tricarballylate dehydrogenase TcuA [Alphaproteobacteria bacterium]
MPDYDVIVVGAGNAALASAVSAKENGADKVLVLEAAARAMRGGNTHWSGGILRFAFDKPRDIEPLLPGVEEEYLNFYEGVTPYTQDDFMGDLMRVTAGRTDPVLSKVLISNSKDTVFWTHEKGGVPMEPARSIAGVEVNGVVMWPPGAIVRAEHEGVGLSASWFKAAERDGVEIRYEATGRELLQDQAGRVAGVLVQEKGELNEITSKAVILAAGGFEANAQWRAQYLGRPWDHAKVRGTSFNQGDGLRMAMEIGAMPCGQWSGRHSTPIDADWADFADRKLTDKSNRLSYLYGVMINRNGKRFVNEGEDTQFYTYAKFGAAILDEPGGKAYQIFDQKTVHLLEPRYEFAKIPLVADTLEELVEKMDIDDKPQAIKTLNDYNKCAADDDDFDPSQKDGVSTKGLDIEKTNWGIRLDKPPFHAYAATGGITFTFGGLRINEEAQVMGTDWRVIPGLYTCGEMVGNLFHYNYPAGTGLVSGQVFGRIAGRNAAQEKG